MTERCSLVHVTSGPPSLHYYSPSCCILAPYYHPSATLQTMSNTVFNLQDNRALFRFFIAHLRFSFDSPSYIKKLYSFCYSHVCLTSEVPTTLHKILPSFYDLKWSKQNSVLWDIMTRIIRNTSSTGELLSNKMWFRNRTHRTWLNLIGLPKLIFERNLPVTVKSEFVHHR